MTSISTLKETLRAAPLNKNSRSTTVKHFIGDWGLLVIFALVLIYLSFASPNFLAITNILNILQQSSVIGLLALGMTFVMITGGIDLSVGSLAGFAGVVAAALATSSSGGLAVPLLVGVVVGALAGYLNSVLIVRGAILPFLATLAMMAVARSAALIFTDGQPISNLNSAFEWLGTGTVLSVPIPIFVFAAFALVADFLLTKTQFGRHVFAVGGNAESAQKVGISINRITMAVYMIAGLLAALGGVVLTSQVNGADPLAGTGYELQAIAAVVIGGTSLFGGVGSIRGTVIGVLLVGVVLNGLNLLNISSYYQQAVQGVILVLAVLLNRWKSE